MSSIVKPDILNVTRPMTLHELIEYQNYLNDWNKWKKFNNISELCRGCETGVDHDSAHNIIDHHGDFVPHPDCYRA
jgi:hypothetical protein